MRMVPKGIMSGGLCDVEEAPFVYRLLLRALASTATSLSGIASDEATNVPPMLMFSMADVPEKGAPHAEPYLDIP
jgi:hypothetical protein